MTRDYDGEELNDINDDIMESLNILSENEVDDYGIIKSKIRVTVQWLSEDDCNCTGFQHDRECPHWVMSL